MYMVLFLLLLACILYVNSKNIVSTLLVFFLILFYVEVVFVQYFFDMDFSVKAKEFESLNLIIFSVTLFISTVYVFTYRVDTSFSFSAKINEFRFFDIIIFIFLSVIAGYLMYTKGIRIDGSFSDHTNERFVIEDYLFPLVIAILIITKARFVIVIGVVALIVSYFMAGERMRMFVYLFALYLLFSGKQNSNIFKISLFFALALSLILSLLRSNFNISDDYHISHFGSVTVSSMYYMEFISLKSELEKFVYLIGILLGNIIPSSFMAEGFDVRRDLFEYASIPGGGWLPVWFLGLYGVLGLVVFSLIFSIFVRVISIRVKKINIINSEFVNDAWIVFFITFVTTLPRWFMYTPYQLVKFPLYAVLAYLGIMLLKNIVKVSLKKHE